MAFKRSAVRSRLSPPGRLAQLVAHPLDVREVTSSSLVSSTKENHGFPRGFCFSLHFSALIVFCVYCPFDHFSFEWIRAGRDETVASCSEYFSPVAHCIAHLFRSLPGGGTMPRSSDSGVSRLLCPCRCTSSSSGHLHGRGSWRSLLQAFLSC